MSQWIDISVPVHNGMVHWPGDPPFHIQRFSDKAEGDAYTVSRMSLGVHTGTHMDAPLHALHDAQSIDQMPLDAAVGPARVIQIEDSKSIKRDQIAAYNIAPGQRILFRTPNSERAWKSNAFDEDFVFVSREAAAFLAECRIRCVGVDYLSVGGFTEDGPETHHALLAAGIWIIEGLNLSGVQPGNYELICLPLKLIGADGAPARAILRAA